jgi:hypothetical protein
MKAARIASSGIVADDKVIASPEMFPCLMSKVPGFRQALKSVLAFHLMGA